jgi:ORF6N domain
VFAKSGSNAAGAAIAGINCHTGKGGIWPAVVLVENYNNKAGLQYFTFQLTKEEFDSLRFQIETLDDNSLRSQIVTSKGRGGNRYLPYAFTEQGVAMLSGVINSDKAISMNIAIMRAFVAVRQVLLKQNDIKEQLREIKERIGEHDVQLNQIYDAMENLLDEKAVQRK